MDANGTSNLSSVPHWEFIVYSAIFRYVAPLILSIGTVGNLICICVLRSSLLRRTSHALMLTILAFIDLGVLHTGLLRRIIIEFTLFDIRTQSSFSCKTHHFFTYTFQQLSSWTIVLITVERMLSLYIPFKIKTVCSMRRVSLTWLVMAIALVCANLHWLVLRDLQLDAKSRVKCKYSSRHEFFFTHVSTWLDFCLLSLIPLTIILPSNCLIMIKVYQMNKARRTQLGPYFQNQHQDMTSLNVMLLVMSFTFVLTTTPWVIYFIGLHRYWKTEPPSELAKTYLAFAILSMLYYINSAFNFFLYCVGGSHFREALWSCFRCPGSSPRRKIGTLRRMQNMKHRRMAPLRLKCTQLRRDYEVRETTKSCSNG